MTVSVLTRGAFGGAAIEGYAERSVSPAGRIKDVIVHRILGVADTPHRIAWGVAIGTLIAWTPTIGIQIVLYLFFATLLRANKVSGIPTTFISNPLSAVPVYWFTWSVGNLAIGGGGAESAQSLQDRLSAAEGEMGGDLWSEIWTADFWSGVLDLLLSMGAELWVGGLIVGVITAPLFYLVARVGVGMYRRSRGRAEP